MWLFVLPNVGKKHNDLKSIGPCDFLSSYEHLKLDPDRIEINMIK